MPDELLPNLFQLKIPLPNSPLKHLNAYVIKGVRRNLVVDTGLKLPECKMAMLNGLKSLDIDLDKVDFFITHFHEDHVGLIGDLVTNSCKVYLSRQDMEFIERLQSLEPMIQAAIKNGYPEDRIRSLFSQRSGIDYGNNWLPCVQFIKNNDVLEIGNYRFHCIHTPGHSMGHICLYDEGKRLLLSGDTVLDGITPNITCWFDDIDPLKNYFESLDKLSTLDVGYVLPGHRGTFNNLKKRIIELKHHHHLRLREIVDIVEKSLSQLSAFEIAKKMQWDVNGGVWGNFSRLLQFFATGEVVSHLRYLEKRNIVLRFQKNPIITYAMSNKDNSRADFVEITHIGN